MIDVLVAVVEEVVWNLEHTLEKDCHEVEGEAVHLSATVTTQTVAQPQSLDPKEMILAVEEGKAVEEHM